ncbi:MAG: polyribonucleotide nucleotidyltransferase [Candidatus Marinimicrobia bacterium]|jgi:polyribonucleotide nucleotidyltransferase|nr:polyribonucleotide nucleotidyltransferase [Candidatus Neomarinimicrobiota bacterium]
MKTKETQIAGKTLRLETGRVARQSNGSVLVTYGETVVLATVNASKEARSDINFFPLQIEYREKHYAGGKIPGGFFKREARPGEHEVLTSRVTDRPLRPLFPKGYKNEVQVMITVLQSDGENMPDILAGIGASSALMCSTIPWNGPIATVRVGRVNNSIVINPTRDQIEESDLEMVVSGNNETIVMVEGEAESMSEAEMLDSLKEAHVVIKEIIDLQLQLVGELNVVKDEFIIPEPETSLVEAVEKEIGKQVQEIVTIVDKHERSDAKNAMIDSILSSLEENFPDDEKDIKSIIEDHFKKGFREQVLSTGLRSDGRKTDDIRKITVEPDVLKRTHGSALFTRGETQALVVTTLGSKRDEQIIDSMNDDYKKSFYLHYNFPPYSVGEVGRIGFTGRREIGHGNLAQRAIKPVLPDYDDFPYTIRIVSEIMESNGSSSMASVCGGSLSLMSAGAPLKAPVAGIAMGLITDGKRHAILSDILGMEDHLGDMDFKLAGTSEGITAIQLDLKIDGLPFELMEQALEQAKVGRIHILDEMNKVMPKPNDISPYAPRIMSIMINPEKIGALIGPGGKNIKKIIEDTTCEVNVDDDGLVTVAGENTVKCNEALDMVKALTFEPEVGMEFEGKVTRLMSFGAFVEFVPGREGMVHISELEWARVEKVEDVLKPGDQVRIKLIKIDDQGRLDFSRRALLEKPEGYVERPKKPRGDRKPFKKRRF